MDKGRIWNALALTCAVALLALVAWLWRQVQPVAMPDLQLGAGERLACVSYAPYHRPGQTPFDPKAHIPPEQIRTDLKALSAIAACVRIYSTEQGLDEVLPAARELGMKVLLGAWIGPEREKNEQALAHALQLANANTDVVDALIVGNEVLLRREQTEEQMAAWLKRAKAESRVPVTYADVWEFWRKHRSLAQWVDQITVHILPFWEDEPVAIDDAVRHVGETFALMQQEFPGKPVRIGETGWPSAGRQRQGSVPSRVNEARFVREFVYTAHANGWCYNFIEAIDQPWKRQLEGTVGGFWGMLDADMLQPKFPLTGPVAERDGLRTPWFAAAGMAVLCALLAGASAPWRQRLAVALAGGIAGVLAVLLWEHAQLAWRNALEWIVLGAVSLCGFALPLALARWTSGEIPAAVQAWQAWRRGHTAVDAATALAALRMLVLFAAAVTALLLAFDPRYRDFPVWQYGTPALLLLALRIGGVKLPESATEERLCALVLAICTVVRWTTEPLNGEACMWLVTGLAMAAVAAECPRRSRVEKV